MAKDYYIILGVPINATSDQIKSAYRQRALEVHPDQAGTDCDAFLEVQEAYSTLGDPVRRRRYDEQIQRARAARPGPARAEPLRAPRPAEPLKPQARRADLGDIDLAEDFQSYSPSIEDVFGRLWSRLSSGDEPKAERMENLTVDIPITAEQAMTGGVARLQLPALVDCPTCGGAGRVEFLECLRCAGHGKLISHYEVQVAFPGGLTGDYVTRVPLEQFGVRNLYLTVRFRVSEVFV